jgi:hypothetical protein
MSCSRRVRLAERYDLAIMSTKGMSVVAARTLLDKIAALVDHVFVLHDFDVSGFSIFGTLGTSSRRYTFESDLSNVIHDIGLRLAHVEAMGLESETVEVKSRGARRETLWRHGASLEEILFLAPEVATDDCRRVELNAMTSRQLVDFVEAAFARHGVVKVVPENAVLASHARHCIEEQLTANCWPSMPRGSPARRRRPNCRAVSPHGSASCSRTSRRCHGIRRSPSSSEPRRHGYLVGSSSAETRSASCI